MILEQGEKNWLVDAGLGKSLHLLNKGIAYPGYLARRLTSTSLLRAVPREGTTRHHLLAKKTKGWLIKSISMRMKKYK